MNDDLKAITPAPAVRSRVEPSWLLFDPKRPRAYERGPTVLVPEGTRPAPSPKETP